MTIQLSASVRARSRNPAVSRWYLASSTWTPENFQRSVGYSLQRRELQDLPLLGNFYPRTNRKLLMQSAHRLVPSWNTQLLLLNLLQQIKTPGKRTETLTKVQEHSGASHALALRQSGVLYCGLLPKVRLDLPQESSHRTRQATAGKSLGNQPMSQSLPCALVTSSTHPTQEASARRTLPLDFESYAERCGFRSFAGVTLLAFCGLGRIGEVI